MLRRDNYDLIHSSEITSEAVYHERRALMKLGASAALLGASPLMAALGFEKSKSKSTLELTPYDQVITYNNFYEYGTDKESPAKLSKNLKTRPWTLSVGGEVQKGRTYDIDELIKKIPLEERIYRFRCVEGWSMVVPWVGFSLSSLLKAAGLTSKSKYVEFETLFDPAQFPGQKQSFGTIPFPYREGLRIDEAMHPLTILAVGLYGKELLPQNGAPIRLVVPWKYGFKSIKSIVKITLSEHQTRSTWNQIAPSEYGFYANVNPLVDHPRWSQKRERVLGKFFKQDTLAFNGYANDVAYLYKNMDLKKFY
ncbi:oxidoreductase molybdopterin binding protein [Sulfuricurvum kujiense DSM 16994]|uniref:Protein-methionine-sulfoxide reductase catalytic subunit MsrP n=1 Tax=Sulfuricurvum kujiense (strain ATCC BAA-921 / DSM 16994 / JCM 11577 / YK-1) TaxID=709032 RepID=E4TYJ8_SULKY|nr:protein-methionine-sulfoxide reductase catalytic subunit MsrP [Sulfuricurvum kujiense]ADR32975.1 oxidoreductase molybdopterin binding protein [Sulfuricurvum kujiense DSM 16994]